MKPYYEHGGITIYHADARDVMDGAVFDVLLTDPPYGIDGGRGGDARDYAKGAYAGEWADTREYVANVCAPLVAKALLRAVRGAVTPGVRNLDVYPRPVDMGCFWTPAAATHGPWGFTTFQPILYYGKDFRAGRGALPSGKQVTERAPRLGHPCPKPEAAWAWLMGKVSQPGETVVDPFGGSGTTAVVAQRMGRRAVLIERHEPYCEIAAKRLEQEVLPLEVRA